MSNHSNFDIRLLEPIVKQIDDPPSDTLDEFYDFEMNFKRFFYEYNHYVLLEVGNERVKLHLYHDVLDAFEDSLCKQIESLSQRKSVTIDFDNIELQFMPIEHRDEAICHIGFIGTGQSNSFLLRLSQVVEKMSKFIDKILKTAVKKQYISNEDISKLVEWQPIL